MWNQAEQALNQSMSRMVTQLASLLPGIVAFLVAVLISGIAAWILAVAVRRCLVSLRFDERLNHSGLAAVTEWSPSRSPALMITRLLAWLVLIAGVLIGVTAFDAAWTSTFLNSLAGYLPNLIAATMVLLVGNITARFLARSVLIGAVNLNLQYARLLSVGVKWLVVVLSVAMALEDLRIGAGIVQLAFGILFGGIVFALALAVGLGSKELVSRSLEREAPNGATPPPSAVDEPFHHL